MPVKPLSSPQPQLLPGWSAVPHSHGAPTPALDYSPHTDQEKGWLTRVLGKWCVLSGCKENI